MGEPLGDVAQQPAVPLGRHPGMGGAAGNAAGTPSRVPTTLESWSSAENADSLLSLGSTSRRLFTIAEEPEGSLNLGKQASPRQPGRVADSAALAGPQQRTRPQQSWTQSFRDSRLEQRFTMYQARMLQPVRAYVPLC